MGFSAGSMTLAGSGKVTATVPAQGTAAANTSGAASVTGTAVGMLRLRFGIGAGQANLFCSYTATLAAGASATYDIYTGTDIKGLDGQAAPFRILRGLEVAVVDGGDEDAGLRIGGAASNEFLGWFVGAGDRQDIFPDSSPYFGSSRKGKTVTSSACNLKVENTSTTEAVTYRILLAGSSFAAGQVMGLFPLVLTYS